MHFPSLRSHIYFVYSTENKCSQLCIALLFIQSTSGPYFSHKKQLNEESQRHHRESFCIRLYSVYFSRTWFFFLDCPAFYRLSLLTTHKTNIHAPHGILLYSLVLCLYFNHTSTFVSGVLHFAVCLYCTTHNTCIHAAMGFKPPTPASDRPQTVALEPYVSGIDRDRTATFRLVVQCLHQLRHRVPPHNIIL